MRFVLRFSVAVLVAAAACQSPPPAPAAGPPVVARAVAVSAAEIAAQGRSVDELSENAFQLLDLIGARISGQPSGERAQDFARARFEAYGLEQVRLEPFPLLGWERGPATLTIDLPAALRDREVGVLSLGHVDAMQVSAELVDAGYGTAEELSTLGARVRGRIMLIRVGEPQGYGRAVHRTEKLTLAAAAGAAGFVMIAPEPGTLIQVGVATLGDEAAPVPAIAANYETGSWLLRVLAAVEAPVVARLTTANRMGVAQAANVLADLAGEGPELILTGAHLDSWDLGTGALDNGSGTLVVLEAARLLAEHVRRSGERPRRGLRFALWMGEELGLYGSRFHVADALRRGSLDQYRAVVNLDMVGAPTGFGAMGRPEAEGVLSPLIRELRRQGFDLDSQLATGGGLYSDHQPFLLRGIPSLYLQSRWPESAGSFYHSAGDTRDKIDEAELAEAAAVVAALLWHVANAPEWPLTRWPDAEIGGHLERMGLRDPLERGGEWRWE